MNSSQSLKSRNIETDIVVVGAGGAGLTAAVAAAEKGGKVLVIEKARKPGGISAMAGGLFGVDSPVQKRLRCNVSKNEVFKLCMEHAHWRTNPRVVRAFIDKSGDTIQWMEDKGVVFDQICSNYPGQFPLTWHAMMPREGGRVIINMLKEQCEALGVEVVHRGTGKRILMDGEGRVEGLMVTTKEEELFIKAKVVIIATGGFGGNKEMLKKYYPRYHENMILIGPPHKGDGIKMAMEAGAATEGLGMALTHGPMCPGFSKVDALARQPETLWVNKYGERFVDEGVTLRFPECGNATDRQPEMTVYSLFDSAIKQDRTERGISHLHVDIPVYTPIEGADESFERAVKKGVAKISDAWEGIAAWMGVEPAVLNATVEEYNASCVEGIDGLFAKDVENLKALRTPPYYGVRSFGSSLGTIGGIKVNEHMEALDDQDRPISGLYVTGSDAGGWESDSYNLATASGSAFGFAINSGRIAGENAADYTK